MTTGGRGPFRSGRWRDRPSVHRSRRPAWRRGRLLLGSADFPLHLRGLASDREHRPLDFRSEPSLKQLRLERAANSQDHRVVGRLDVNRAVEEPRVSILADLPDQAVHQLRRVRTWMSGRNGGTIDGHDSTSRCGDPGRPVSPRRRPVELPRVRSRSDLPSQVHSHRAESTRDPSVCQTRHVRGGAQVGRVAALRRARSCVAQRPGLSAISGRSAQSSEGAIGHKRKCLEFLRASQKPQEIKAENLASRFCTAEGGLLHKRWIVSGTRRKHRKTQRFWISTQTPNVAQRTPTERTIATRSAVI